MSIAEPKFLGHEPVTVVDISPCTFAEFDDEGDDRGEVTRVWVPRQSMAQPRQQRRDQQRRRSVLSGTRRTALRLGFVLCALAVGLLFVVTTTEREHATSSAERVGPSLDVNAETEPRGSRWASRPTLAARDDGAASVAVSSSASQLLVTEPPGHAIGERQRGLVGFPTTPLEPAAPTPIPDLLVPGEFIVVDDTDDSDTGTGD